MIKERNRKMLETFMRNVTWLRKQHGISKKRMAQMLGIGVGSLNKIENGQMPQRLGVEILERIYIHFGITPQEQLVKDLAVLCATPEEPDSLTSQPCCSAQNDISSVILSDRREPKDP